WAQHGEHDFLAVRRRYADANITAEHRHHAVAGRSHQEDGLVGRAFAHVRVGDERLALVRGKALKKRAPRQQLPSIHRRHPICGRHRFTSPIAIGSPAGIRPSAARAAPGRTAHHGRVNQSRAARWAVVISRSDISAAISWRSRTASALPAMAARLNHLCAETRSTGTEEPTVYIMPSSKNSLPPAVAGRPSLLR